MAALTGSDRMWWIALEAAFIQALREGAVKTEIALLRAGCRAGSRNGRIS